MSITRREALATLSTVPVLAALPASTAAAKGQISFIPCLNMSTIRGQKLGFRKELEIASKAGFSSVEIWIDSLQEYLKSGNNTANAKLLIADLGLKIENAIGFASWIVDDEAIRNKGMEQLKNEMTILAEIGCQRIATPPVGAQSAQSPTLDLARVAERYRAVLKLSDQTGVIPQLELWGFSKNLNKLSEVMYVAIESGHPSARLLLDVYHLYKGGSSLDSLALVGKKAIEIFHINDYPSALPPDKITDADRIYPGDGVAPIKTILQAIKNPVKPIVVSLEVFNKTYYAQDPLEVAKMGLTKIKNVLAGV